MCFEPIIAALKLVAQHFAFFFLNFKSCPGSGRPHVRDEPAGREGPELRSHVRHTQPDIADGEPAATPT